MTTNQQNFIGRSVWGVLAQTMLYLSPIVLLALYTYVINLYHLYDRGQAFTKLIVFVALAALIVYLTRRVENIKISDYMHWIEIVFLLVVIIVRLNLAIRTYALFFFSPPQVDIGVSTQIAALMLVGKQSPYQSQFMSNIGNNPDLWGYHHGPMMIIGYLPSALWTQGGFKMMNIVYLSLTVVFMALILYNRKKNLLYNLATMLYAIALFIIPARLWHELFWQGVNDALPVLLLLMSFYFIKKSRLFWAGLATGLTFSANFALAAVMGTIMLRKRLPLSFVYGGLLGHAAVGNIFSGRPDGITEQCDIFSPDKKIRFNQSLFLDADSATLFISTSTSGGQHFCYT